MVSILVSTGVFLLFIAALLGLGFLFDTCDERHRDTRIDAGVEVVRPVKQVKIGGALIVAEKR